MTRIPEIYCCTAWSLHISQHNKLTNKAEKLWDSCPVKVVGKAQQVYRFLRLPCDVSECLEGGVKVPSALR